MGKSVKTQAQAAEGAFALRHRYVESALLD